MSFNYFTFNGQRLEDFGFIIKKKPQYFIAEKDYTSEEIAGKDGNIIAYKLSLITEGIRTEPQRIPL